MSTIPSSAEQRVVLDDVSWSTYVSLVDGAEKHRGLICYDRGVMEIMSPSKKHETVAELIGRMVDIFTEELGIDVCSVRSTTFRRADCERGFEADESYYIQHAQQVRHLDEIDLTVHPPPDLIVEVDVSRSSMDKFGIFGSLQVPEVWRYVGDSLKIYVHRTEGGYDCVDDSIVLPGFPLEEVKRNLSRCSVSSETQLIREFRQFVQSQN
ncbi:Uma2 family endonuclease [Pirellulales bacterium]|nr:Uma2 family endonuclease [Pirellulales bacterium]